MDIAKDLKIVSASLRCPELMDKNVTETVCYMVARFNKLETSDAYSIILQYIPESIQAWKEGKSHNLSSAIYIRAKFYLLNATRDILRRERIEAKKDHISLDANTEETGNLHEQIEGKSETIDWKNAFNYFIENAGFTDREKQVFIGMKDGKTCRAIGEEFGVSGAAINLSQKAIYSKINRIKHKAIG